MRRPLAMTRRFFVFSSSAHVALPSSSNCKLRIRRSSWSLASKKSSSRWDELGTRRYVGRSIEVVDGEGRLVLGSGGWFSVRDDVSGCAPVITGFDTNPQPCPAG
jgi:hypothetical protein